MTAVIEVNELRKTYRPPFRRRRVRAVDGISFAVEAGEIFGFLGPNGAGKTSTIRMLMGLIAPSGGRARIFGHRIPSRRARARLGFLPEAPYFYDYLTVVELLDLVGRIFGAAAAERRRRADELIERVGLAHARATPMRKFSKGMLQRAGVAQALMGGPDLVVLDEPMSGLDPIGRRDVREIIQSLRDDGKTVFLSSHILADVEALCDRVAIVARGAIQDIGTVSEIVDQSLVATDLLLRVGDGASDGDLEALREQCSGYRRRDRELAVTIDPGVDVDAFIARALSLHLHVTGVSPRHETLEDVFVRRAREAERARAEERAQ